MNESRFSFVIRCCDKNFKKFCDDRRNCNEKNENMKLKISFVNIDVVAMIKNFLIKIFSLTIFLNSMIN